MNDSMLDFYKYVLTKNTYPEFIYKYLELPILTRLKDIGYFCGMDYASKDIYDFSEYISRYDHSLTVALMIYKYTNDKELILSGLIHDISTPCFSHVIDYMNKDYNLQESTEVNTSKILLNNSQFLYYLNEDKIDAKKVVDFKNNSLVDSKRPKLCADRIDGIILNSIGWTKNINKKDIVDIIDSIKIYNNEDNELEFGFKYEEVGKKVIELNNIIDEYAHSNEDNYMMDLLSRITEYSINKKYISYDDLYYFNEKELFIILNNISDEYLRVLLHEFYTIKKDDIKYIDLPEVKVRKINPIVNNRRML